MEHAGKYCSTYATQSHISSLEPCKQACASDADCKYVYWCPGCSTGTMCHFSLECSLHTHAVSSVTTYVSFPCVPRGSAGAPSPTSSLLLGTK